jgi:hypothetical protein
MDIKGGNSMRRLVLITAFIIAILSPASDSRAQSSGAPRFVSLEGRFSIALPDRSDVRRMNMPTPYGYGYGHQHEWETKEGSFGVGYADTFQLVSKPEDVKQFFDAAAERFRNVAAVNGFKVPEPKQITLDGRPGIEQRADLPASTIIRRLYLVSRRVYETAVVMKNNQRKYESAAVGVLDSFRLLTDREITEEALKAGPGPLPQTPEAPRAGSDADDEGLRGRVKSVHTEIQYLTETPLTRMGMRSRVTTYNQNRNKLRTESYDSRNNLYLITVYGYLDGSRVAAFKYIDREYGPPTGSGGAGPATSERKMDPRYQHRFEFKYDEKKRLSETTEFRSNGDFMARHVYKYDGNQKQEFVYLEDGTLTRRHLYILDDKGNEIESTDFDADGKVLSKISYSYEYDANGNWTKRTSSRKEGDQNLLRLDPGSVQMRTITYY